MTSWPIDEGVFNLGDLAAERGGVIRDAKLSWQTHGTLNADRSNVIVYPTSYTATHEGQSWAIGPDMLLDPDKYFIVIPDMFSNGLSSGADNTPDYPPLVTVRDNVLAQERLLREQFGIETVAAVYGFSMGAMQAYHWAALFPERVQRAFIVCGSARTAVHGCVRRSRRPPAVARAEPWSRSESARPAVHGTGLRPRPACPSAQGLSRRAGAA